MPKKQPSLRLELWELSQALDGARMLCEQLRARAFPDAEDARNAPGAVSAIVTAVAARLRDLGREED